MLERGDARVDVKCAADDATKACADITLQMLDRLATCGPEPALARQARARRGRRAPLRRSCPAP